MCRLFGGKGILNYLDPYEQVAQGVKPSDFLLQAHEEGIKKVEGESKKDDGYCSLAVIELLADCYAVNVFSAIGQLKYNKEYNELIDEEKKFISNVFTEFMLYNDSSPDVTFKDVANFLIEKYNL